MTWRDEPRGDLQRKHGGMTQGETTKKTWWDDPRGDHQKTHGGMTQGEITKGAYQTWRDDPRGDHQRSLPKYVSTICMNLTFTRKTLTAPKLLRVCYMTF